MDKGRLIGGAVIVFLFWLAWVKGPGENGASDSGNASTKVEASGVCAGIHIVKAGETLSGIAEQYGYTVAVLAKASTIANPNMVKPGKTICLPKRGSADTSNQASGGAAASCNQKHIVLPGETLDRIAAQYGTTVEALVARNGISNANYIRAGEEYCVSP